MVKIETEVSQESVNALNKALADYETKMGRGMKDALRSITIDIVKSLRKRTRSAPKQVLRSEVTLGVASPKYLRGGRVRRVRVYRWYNGMKVPTNHWQVVGTTQVRRRNGQTVERDVSTSRVLRDARQNYGKIRNWGLAKKSWGWFMKSLFHKAMQDTNPKAVITGRMVDQAIESRDGKTSITIWNKLSYIRKAMPPGAVEFAVRAALKSIEWKVQHLHEETRRGCGL